MTPITQKPLKIKKMPSKKLLEKFLKFDGKVIFDIEKGEFVKL